MATLLAFIVLGGGSALAAFLVSSNSQVGPGTISGHRPPNGAHSNVISGSIAVQDLATASVTAGKLGADSVSSPKIADGQVGTQDLANGAVTASKISTETSHLVAPAVYGDCVSPPQTGTFCDYASVVTWRNYATSPGYEGASFFKDAAGVVHLQGLVQCVGDINDCNSNIKAGTEKIFFLPAGYRPAAGLVFSSDSAAGHTRIDVRSDGAVAWIAVAGGDAGNYVTLSGISFRASQ